MGFLFKNILLLLGIFSIVVGGVIAWKDTFSGYPDYYQVELEHVYKISQDNREMVKLYISGEEETARFQQLKYHMVNVYRQALYPINNELIWLEFTELWAAAFIVLLGCGIVLLYCYIMLSDFQLKAIQGPLNHVSQYLYVFLFLVALWSPLRAISIFDLKIPLGEDFTTFEPVGGLLAALLAYVFLYLSKHFDQLNKLPTIVKATPVGIIFVILYFVEKNPAVMTRLIGSVANPVNLIVLALSAAALLFFASLIVKKLNRESVV